jgi:hypothetical protein
MTRPTTLVLAALVLLLKGAAVRAEATTATIPPATAEVQHLQGTWEGALVGQESAGKITITFTGNSLHFQGLRADQWYDATFTLREGTRPRQLRATITGSALVRDIGTVIGAIFKIENRTLSLAGLEDDGTSDDSAVFDGNTIFHYRFRKVEPQAKKAGAPKLP